MISTGEASCFIAVLIRATRGGHRWIDRDVFIRIAHFRLLRQVETLSSVTQLYHRFEGECSVGVGRAGGREGRRIDKGIVLRRHGDILVGNGEGIVRLGRFGERHIRRSPPLEGNVLTALTLPFIGRDAHRVVLKEFSAGLCIENAGTSERAVHDLHRMGRTEAVRGVAVGFIHIDCVVCVAETLPRIKRHATIALPFDRHPAGLRQGQSAHRINAGTVHIRFIIGIGRIDRDLAGGVDGHIGFRINTVNLVVYCDARSFGADRYLCMTFNGDLTCCVDAEAVVVRAACCGIDCHIGVTRDRHISAHSAGGKAGADSVSITTTRGCIDRELTAAAVVCGNDDVASGRGCNDTRIAADGNGVVADQLDGQVTIRSSAERNPPTVVAAQRQCAGGGIIVGVVIVFVAALIAVFVITAT